MKRSLLSLALLFSLSACTGPVDPPPSSIKPIDQGTAVAVEMNIKTDPDLAVAGIKATAENDMVVLRGTVPSDAAKAKAEELASKTRGVGKIANHIEVVAGEGQVP